MTLATAWLMIFVFGAHPDWKTPACKPWPEGRAWAGGMNYDVYGCGYPSLSGQCTIEEEGRPGGCFEYKPPRLVFKHEATSDGDDPGTVTVTSPVRLVRDGVLVTAQARN